MSEQNPTFDPEFARRAFDQFWQIFLVPELERRAQIGKPISTDKIYAFQLIQGADHENKIHINDEVAVDIVAKVCDPSYEAGQQLKMDEIEGIEKIDLTKDYQNSGHATFIKFKGNWIFTFSFIYNKKRGEDHLAVASEFLSASSYALENQIWHAFVENLFAAVELMSKLILMEHPDKAFLKIKTHNVIRSKINHRRKINAFGAELAMLLNELSKLRPPARYISKPLGLDGEKARQMYNEAAEIHELLSERASAALGVARASEGKS